MPQPLKIKIFMDADPGRVEEQINAFIASASSITIIKTETVIAAVAEKPNEGTRPCIVVTIWYEPPASDRERPGFRVG
ncbi:MAG TPA: hypothetical protein VNX23_01080 [Bradyrhizobium sp.]|jgi:hypothetical protein|uniref:hypothetical protein n=1 Tax=Bradyrhizobium sp. TaxID=376 RepID=UPI002D0969C3|nr:hypothetical protein [Bradyrhizobium sp.]HXB75997.1 hypothetical protein [Bradyrhizobium sp.]